MSVAESHAPDSESVIADPRIAICLSGGGFRAALFHLGALRRLNELGVLSKVGSIASVSGGSILAGHLATALRPWPAAGTAVAADRWSQEIEQPFHQFVKHDIRTWPILKRILFPWNWCRPSTQVLALQARYARKLTALKLQDLPDHPWFIFCGTDVTFGVLWVFEKNRVGSYQAGYVTPSPNWPVAQAIAASSCFPPIFAPMPITLSVNETMQDGLKQPRPKVAGEGVSDGGLYDNLGLQPVTKYGTVLVSDGGAPFVAATPSDLFGRLNAYLEIVGKQGGSLRKRQLMADYRNKKRAGTYWGISSAPSSYQTRSSYQTPAQGYSKQLAETVISRVRTDMDAFSDAEIAVLENHGYLLADIAIEVHAPQLKTISAPKQVPHPEYLDEAKVRSALKHSHERRWFGRK
jgi:NTE family protein